MPDYPEKHNFEVEALNEIADALTGVSDASVPSTAREGTELVTTSVEGLEGHFYAIGASDVTASEYRIVIDLSDTANFPHENTGSIIVTASFLTVDKENTAQGAIQVGVITRIDATSADISYIQGFSFEKSGSTSIVRDRVFSPNRINCKVTGGQVEGIATNFTATNVTEVNTATPLPNSVGSTSTPAVGDLVCFFDHSAGGAFNPAVSGFYYTEQA